jgi:hypothetical protein
MKPGPNPKSARRRREGQHSVAFTLIEVMIACGIFFMAVFTILALVSTVLRNARKLESTTVDAGMVAAQLSLTNKLYEGWETGDFGDSYPGYVWNSEDNEVMSNGLHQIDFEVHHRVGRDDVGMKMSILLFRPDSPPGRMSGGISAQGPIR